MKLHVDPSEELVHAETKVEQMTEQAVYGDSFSTLFVRLSKPIQRLFPFYTERTWIVCSST